MHYSVQYTISTLTGGYAQKYSVTIREAERLASLLRLARVDASLEDFASGGERREYDPFLCFHGLMKVLKYAAKDGRRTFCTGIAFEPLEGGVSSGACFEDSDEAGAFVVKAYGERGMVFRDGVGEVFDVMRGALGSYRAVLLPMRDVFKDDLMNLLNLCEETMAKDARIVAAEVSSDAAGSAPLVQF
ncbi:MAG: hypothetical protein FWC40_05335 [Proteobacteria bacterium]|nr:hypothetical protein [Pseudomonadota bacterium]